VYEVRFNRVDLNFFRAFEVPVLAGRGFEAADIAAVVVNRTFAQRIFGGDALGRRVRYAGKSSAAAQNGESGRWYEIVGIVRDFPTGASPGMDDSPLKLYHPVAAGQVQPMVMTLRVRGGAPSTFAGRLREIAAAVDPDLQLRNIFSLDEAMRREQWIRRLEAAVLGAVTLSVLMLSAAGIYALMSITVSQRRKEIAIRTALGADRRRIVASIFSRALGQLAVGVALGMASGALLDKASGGDLMGSNAVILPLVALFMMAVGFLAALGPARRSLRIEPTEALREQ
jgi:ABC-type antimicrobial peptide transport system permease subunit